MRPGMLVKLGWRKRFQPQQAAGEIMGAMKPVQILQAGPTHLNHPRALCGGPDRVHTAI